MFLIFHNPPLPCRPTRATHGPAGFDGRVRRDRGADGGTSRSRSRRSSPKPSRGTRAGPNDAPYRFRGRRVAEASLIKCSVRVAPKPSSNPIAATKDNENRQSGPRQGCRSGMETTVLPLALAGVDPIVRGDSGIVVHIAYPQAGGGKHQRQEYRLQQRRHERVSLICHWL